MLTTREPAVLVLEDGRTFTGRAYGHRGTTVGEAVFSTGMTGYQETLTDPSYHRQVVVMTAPHVGNTGWNDEDDESGRIWVAGYVVRDPALRPSSWRSRRPLEDELDAQGVVGICDLDTRALTRHLRERGAMRVGIFSGDAARTPHEQLLARVVDAPPMTGAALAEQVATDTAYVVPAVGERRFTVAAVDLGIKAMTPQMMAERGIEVHVLPATATIEDVRAVAARRRVLLQRPGRPEHRRARRPRCCATCSASGSPTSASASATRSSARRSGSAPTSSSTATAASTSRSWTARPARSRSPRTTTASRSTPRSTARARRPSAGCGSATSASTTTSSRAWSASTCPAFSVQYHPEAAAGPHDAAYLFDRFVDLMSDAAEPATTHQEVGA